MARKKDQGPTPIKGKWFMTQSTGSLRRRLEKYPNLGDEWVKEQLERIGKSDLYFNGIADAIRNRAVSTEESYLKNPKHREFRETPGNEGLKKRTDVLLGNPTQETYTTQLPQQSEFQQGLLQAGAKPIAQAYSKIGQELPLAAPVNQILQGLAQQYQQEFGRGGGGPQYFSGPGVDAYRNMPPLAEIMASLNPRPMVNAAAPYAQSAYNAAAPYAQSAYNAAQPYAQKAGQFGMDALGALQSKAQNLGGAASQGIGNLLNMLLSNSGGR